MTLDPIPAPRALPLQLFDCVQADDLDRALALGLMAYLPDPQHDVLDADCPQVCATLLGAQQRLRDAWAARERYRARAARLQRRAAERDARRAPAPAPSQPATPALPPLAAAILARAKAKAAGGAQP
ncbi:hypothetical protein ACQR5V_16100 [Xanthomonas oryzae pv. oryzicola]|uniref:Uncharacterized protein n=2 Tax=Xanthomonas oryzae TaxID=347 RepID=G7T9X1_XANOB|nr:hypothetical protein [Xanthomonas oryzae]AEQ95971.1 hypothetical protein XOC_1810 [Xanthomonas oryzae pv. oryzicola BLS256]AJQ87133.1 hypothetical protein BE73_08490 [Xanthomonas oryzae pv. oryzicola]AKK63623.1 hypothetical protein FE36_07075 [Xanthomonas oryzae pv. oryzicola]AKN92980.1 hypothetical protein ACU13_07990 [Xanthomonas oryzae pv. oryzicola]AKN96710.1 hypothetical protein ACU10_07945 [Xanthomonas oryzae pv. oryzicola]